MWRPVRFDQSDLMDPDIYPDEDEPSIDLDEFEEAIRRLLTYDEATPDGA